MKGLFDFKSKSLVSIIISGIAIVVAVIALIIYTQTGVTNYTANKLDSGVILFSILGIVVSAASIVFDFKLVKHAAFLLLLVAFVDYVVFEIDYIGSIFVGIDNTPVTTEFVMTFGLMLASTVLSLLCAILTKDPFDRKEVEAQ